MTSSEASRADKDAADASGGRRVFPRVTSLTSLVGAHPDALRALYGAGRPTDPAELGEAPRKLVLAIGEGTELFLLRRLLLQLPGNGVLTGESKTFDHGGNSGRDVVFGKQVFRFRVEIGASVVDGKPALILSYGDSIYKNPWPLRACVDELRTVGDRIAIGPGLFHGRAARPTVLGWFGLSAH